MSDLKASCPICGGEILLPADIEVTEIITCNECYNRVVVEKIEGGNVILGEAPEIDEDWGQ
ncbi:MAG: lysine biosynthesis protein LysW [Candidatus Nealsonbacteria bacterium]|nr:MAG: lysine biosynthesis protein LysW [Candidatus Nealsonbacteria bacterium]